MCANQSEGGGIMIECHLLPLGRLVTRAANRPKLPIVFILRRMAGITVLRRTLINPIHMT